MSAEDLEKLTKLKAERAENQRKADKLIEEANNRLRDVQAESDKIKADHE
jgi:hypothetical protein